MLLSAKTGRVRETTPLRRLSHKFEEMKNRVIIHRLLSIAAGTLYMILKRLKEAGYVETYLQESASGPARKYYHLTEAGTAYQQEKKQEWLDFTQQINRLISDETI